jgi:D-sedoheptulose 7-phosphate isomerase
MKNQKSNFSKDSKKYLNQLNLIFSDQILIQVEKLAIHLRKIWQEERNLFICGNGGSAANAIHLANDFHYGVGACGNPPYTKGLKVEALPANAGVITCLGNDIGYENIYSHQLNNKATTGDLLIVLSGSGNSKNICNVLETANEKNVFSYAILGFDGGKSLNLADCPIHFAVNDMQIAEDTQLIVGHLCMQWLTKNKPNF